MQRGTARCGPKYLAGLLVGGVLLAGCGGGAIDTAPPASPATSATSAPVAATPRLASVDNFRDVAGEGYANAAGQHLTRGVLYRSNALTPNPADQAALDALHPTAVYDVRTAAEITQKPERVPAGAVYTNIPILSGDLTAAVKTIKTPDGARAFLTDMYRSFVTGPQERAGFAKLLTAVANTAGPQVINCTGGKDRTGWAAALLLIIAGVPQDTITKDYLLSNDYSRTSVQTTMDQIRASQGEAVAKLKSKLVP